MKFGFSITGRGPLTASEAVSAIARRAEELEFDLVLAPDHLVVPKDIASTYPYNRGRRIPRRRHRRGNRPADHAGFHGRTNEPG